VVAAGGLGQAITEEGTEQQARRLQLGWMLATLAVGLPATAGTICGFLYAIGYAQYRGANLTAPTWLGTALWTAAMTTLGLGIVFCLVPWPRRRMEPALIRVAVASLTLTGLLCGVASVAVPS